MFWVQLREFDWAWGVLDLEERERDGDAPFLPAREHSAPASSGCRVQGAGCRVQGAGCRVQGAGCRVQGAGCRAQGSGVACESTQPRGPGGYALQVEGFWVRHCGFRVKGEGLGSAILYEACLNLKRYGHEVDCKA